MDHRQRVREIVQSTPPLRKEDESYIEDTVVHPVRVGFFTEYACDRTWLRWITQRPVFQSIFEPVDKIGTIGKTLARWFCDNYVAHPEWTYDALQVIGDRGGRLGPALGTRVVDALRSAAGDRGFGEGLSRWIPLVVAEQLPEDTRRSLWWMLEKACDPVQEREILLLLFGYLTAPVPALSSRGILPEVKPRVKPVLDHLYWFTEIWERLFKPNLEQLAGDLMPILDHHLHQAHHIAQCGQDSEAGPESITRNRPAIEPHEQNRLRTDPHDLHPLIDAARDTLETLLQYSLEQSEHYLRIWGRSGFPLLKPGRKGDYAPTLPTKPTPTRSWLKDSNRSAGHTPPNKSLDRPRCRWSESSKSSKVQDGATTSPYDASPQPLTNSYPPDHPRNNPPMYPNTSTPQHALRNAGNKPAPVRAEHTHSQPQAPKTESTPTTSTCSSRREHPPGGYPKTDGNKNPNNTDNNK